ncbi:MAG: hypothetical protein ACYS9X_03170 [Planctomycetota bacterium]|jgi:hypothetical protein
MTRSRRVPNALCVTAAVACAVSGAFYATGGCTDDRGLGFRRACLRDIRDELDGLAGHLRRFEEKHGRYPTNDEGLAALDTFEARFAVRFPVGARPGTVPWLQGLRPWDWPARHEARRFRAERGRVPSSSAELIEAEMYDEDTWGPLGGDEAVTLDVAIDGDDRVWVIAGGGVLSPFGPPYVYENRAGLPAKSFVGSPADADPRRRFSVRVAEGVSVASVGAELLAREYDSAWWDVNWPRFAGGALLVIAAALVLATRRGRAAAVAAAGVGLLASLGAHQIMRTFCYLPAPFFSSTNPAAIERRRELLEKYHEQGVIGEEAYRKALSLPGIARPGDNGEDVGPGD